MNNDSESHGLAGGRQAGAEDEDTEPGLAEVGAVSEGKWMTGPWQGGGGDAGPHPEVCHLPDRPYLPF